MSIHKLRPERVNVKREFQGPIPLLDAYICLDCDLIHANDICPKCASDKSFPVSCWLNRPCPCTRETAATLSQLGNYCQTCNQERKAS